MKKIVLALLLAVSVVFSMQFGSVGNPAFGMAGTGVAVKESAYGQFFNPALIATDDRYKLGISLDARLKSKEFFNLFDMNLDNISQNEVQSVVDTINRSFMYVESRNGGYMLFNGPIGALGVGMNYNVFGSTYANVTYPDPKNLKNVSLDVTASYSVYNMLEVPVAYAYEFLTDGGDISIGASVSYINMSKNYGSFNVNNSGIITSVGNMLDFSVKDGASNAGVDLGLLYSYKFLSVGIVGKYLNAPKFTFSDGSSYRIDPQARAGIATKFGFFTLAADVDLTKNSLIGYENFKEQLVTFGTQFDFKYAQLRGGVSFDLEHKEDVIFGLGLGLSIFDIGVQFGKKSIKFDGYRIPTYVALNVGVGFSF